jgi:hypothetical protein
MEELPELPEPQGKTTDYKVAGLTGGPGLMTRPAELYAAGLRPSGQFTADQMRSYALLAVKAERERCARIAERWRNTMDKSPVEQILSAIRKG